MFKQLGYYTCDNKQFDKKLEAMIYASNKDLDIKWHFNDEVFNSYNWSIEPIESLDTLYDRRARQIREQFDYVILSYSGGSDSHNILESFLRQGLHIDEVVTKWALDANSKFIVRDPKVTSTWNNAAEFYLNTSDKLQYIRDKSPKTKITLLDTSNLMIDSLLQQKDASWITNKSDKFNITGALNYNPIYFSELRKRLDHHQKVCWLSGLDKPKMIINDNCLYLYFIDKAVSMAPVREHVQEYENITPVFFYWAPETCDLICKQAHTVLKYIKAFPQYKHLWQSTDINDIRITQEQLLRTILYTTWNSSWFQVDKPTADWYNQLDDWFIKGWVGTKEYIIWQEGLKTLTTIIPKFIRRNKIHNIPTGTIPFYSKYHFIGTFDTL